MNTRLARVLVAALALVLTACDETHEVEIRNEAAVPLVVRELDDGRELSKRELRANETFKDVWLIAASADERTTRVLRRIEARTVLGDLIFCRTYTWQDLSSQGWRVVIRPGDACS